MVQQKVEYEFNVTRLMEDIRIDGESLRQLEQRSGISASTWSRIDNGHLPDMQTFLQILAVVDMPPERYFTRVIWERAK